MNGRVLVSHPHAAVVATGAARSLDRAGMLAAYVTGIALPRDGLAARLMKPIFWRLPEATNRLIAGIEPSRLRSLAVSEIAARFTGRVARSLGLGKVRPYDVMFVMHDAAVAAISWPGDVQIVYAYEDAALQTFRRAARRHVKRVWDLPLPHWATLERMWLAESKRWPGAMGTRPPIEPAWKKMRKQSELALADALSVASRFTLESLVAAEVHKPIAVVPYGFPVDAFEPKPARPDGPFTVLAVGTQNLRKGTPYLLEAWKRAGLRDARLRLVGPMQLGKDFLAPYQGLFEHVPHIPRSHLATEYHGADLLALPTLGDGFGLVIQEAMCCGTPVLTTRCGGGPECIDDGLEGWIAPERDVDALVDRLREAASKRNRLIEMGRAARRRAERWTWREAGEALVSALGRF